MSSKNDVNKVITLPARAPASAPEPARLDEPLKSVRDASVRRVAELTGALFENVDDALFDRAEHARSNALQAEFFEAMREIRKKRQRAERVLLEAIERIFADFALDKLIAPQGDAPAGNGSTLSLLGEAELEESLAISGMVTKAESRLSRQLYALNRRLSAVRGGAAVTDATNPIGPAQLCDALRRMVAEFEIDLPVRLIVYKLGDRFVMSALDLLYDEVNTQLIRAGVLPQLRHRMASAPPGTSAGATPAATPAAGAGNAPRSATAAEASADSYDAGIYDTLRNLLALRHATLDEATSATSMPLAHAEPDRLAPADLLSALHILQNQMLQSLAADALSARQSGARELKRVLLEQADQLQAGQRASIAHVDEDTIDLVGMLFEFIVQDRALPSSMQALLGRLQIPYLKIAILDRRLFTHKNHPARELLDQMAQACIGKSDTSDASDDDQALYDRIREIVEAILRDFDDDVGTIERARSEFSDWLCATRRRAELAEKRTAETARGREKLDHARRLATSEMRARCAERDLPALVHGLLNGPFVQFLVLTALRQGDKSVEWRQALGFADTLVWSVAPKVDDAARARLGKLLPTMLDYLRESLHQVAWRDDDIDKVQSELKALYAPALQPTAADAAVPPAASEDATTRPSASAAAARPAAALLEQLERTVRASDYVGVPEPNPVDAVDAIYLDQVKQMQVGTWVEFGNPDTGAKERAKLSWISPISSKYLFVDRKGLKVADKTVAALAAELAAGRVTLLDDSQPLFERAMGAVVERLRTFLPPPAETSLLQAS
jgi:hypothetical protein